MVSSFQTRPPIWLAIVAGLLAAWNLIGCYFCYMQFKFGADAMPGATDYDRALMATMPGWYNYCYAVAVGAGALGGIAMLTKAKMARPLFFVSLIALLIQFGYLFAASDIVAHKGMVNVVPFPVLIAVIAAFSVWLSDLAIKRGWLR